MDIKKREFWIILLSVILGVLISGLYDSSIKFFVPTYTALAGMIAFGFTAILVLGMIIFIINK